MKHIGLLIGIILNFSCTARGITKLPINQVVPTDPTTFAPRRPIDPSLPTDSLGRVITRSVPTDPATLPIIKREINTTVPSDPKDK